MNLYEVTFVVRYDLPAQEVHKLSESYSAYTNRLGGKVVKKEYWGLRHLAYEINKNKKGHYVFLVIEGHTSVIDKLRDDFKIKEDVINHFVLRVDEVDDRPSLMMQAPNEDDK